MSTIIIITPPPRIAERSAAVVDGNKVVQGDATLFTCSSPEDAVRWLQHLQSHPHTGCNPD